MTDTRNQIYSHVADNAGVHFNDLVRETDFAPGQVQHHLRQLLDQEKLVREKIYGQTHYYPPVFDEWERHALALFRRETSREIVEHLLAHGADSPNAVAHEIGIARSTLEYHVNRLVECSIVQKEYDENRRVTISLEEPERTRELLEQVTPTVPDRLFDRFSRLVDELFEGDGHPVD